jgi:hypothetical protein
VFNKSVENGSGREDAIVVSLKDTGEKVNFEAQTPVSGAKSRALFS